MAFDTLSNARISKAPRLFRMEAVMARGGKREGAGRPKGARNLRMRDMHDAAAAGGEMPIAYMLRVMRDKDAPSLRRDAMAKTVAAYFYPRVAAAPEDEQDEPEPQEESESASPAPSEAVDQTVQ